MKKILVNYNFTPDKSWIGDDYLIYDRSDDGIDHLKDFNPAKIIKTLNTGQVDYDKLGYLVDNYDNLPDVFLWGKTNLFKSVTEETWAGVKDNQFFTPLLRYDHPCISDQMGPCSYYLWNMYWERNSLLWMSDWKYFETYASFARAFGIPAESFVPFAPGGNYILTKETVHKYPKESYAMMRALLPYTINPVEAHFCERAYYTIWRNQ